MCYHAWVTPVTAAIYRGKGPVSRELMPPGWREALDGDCLRMGWNRKRRQASRSWFRNLGPWLWDAVRRSLLPALI